MAITRRQFLKTTAATAAALGAGPAWRRLPGTGVAYAAGPGDAIVVFVRLYGGNDGINTVYPLAGAQRAVYEDVRPTLKLPGTTGEMTPWVDEGIVGSGSDPFSIGTNGNGSDYALHPAMGALHQIHQAGRLAVVPGVHYAFPDHSHFRSEVIWYTGDPLGNAGLGWFGKYMNLAGFAATDVPGVLLGDELVPIFTPTNSGLLVFNGLDELVFPATDETLAKQATFLQLYAQSQLAGAAFPELTSLATTGMATVGKIQDYYKTDSGLANAGKVEALFLDGNGDYDRANPLVYGSPLNSDATPALRGMDLARDLRHVAPAAPRWARGSSTSPSAASTRTRTRSRGSTTRTCCAR
ncbi:MAG: twin-arginine translocation signal domain-containing protein [Candidatus Binatia bacterium]